MAAAQPPVSVDAVDSDEAVHELAVWLFGDGFEEAGVVHPTACVATPDGSYRAMRIESRTPRSPHDLFALHFQRARADVIVSTGAILRAEDDLRYDLEASPYRTGLVAYRAALGKTRPATVVVLSRRADLSREHPAWSEPHVELWSPHAISGIPHRAFAGSPSEAIEALRPRGLVVVEAGPSVTRGLHADDAVDALYLTTFEGTVEEALLAGAAFDDQGLRTRLPSGGPARLVGEPSGPWRFRRYGREPVAASP